MCNTGFFQTRQRAFIGVMMCAVGTAIIPASGLSFEPYIFHGVVSGFLTGIGATILYVELKKDQLSRSLEQGLQGESQNKPG